MWTSNARPYNVIPKRSEESPTDCTIPSIHTPTSLLVGDSIREGI